MRLFLSYGFNSRDEWVPDLVEPLLTALGVKIESGRVAGGRALEDEITRRIKRCHGIVAFTTRRQQLVNGEWTTHDWVTQEMAVAHGSGRRILEVREEGVTQVGGIVGHYARLVYSEAKRDECLVNIAIAIAEWNQRTEFQLQLLPSEFQGEIRSCIPNRQAQCTCEWMDSVEDDVQALPVELVPKAGGIFVRTPALPATALVRLRVRCLHGEWVSNFENVDSLNVHLIRSA